MFTDHFEGLLVSVGVERRHQVDARSLHQPLDFAVAVLVLLAQILHEEQDHLAAHCLISVETGSETELWLP